MTLFPPSSEGELKSSSKGVRADDTLPIHLARLDRRSSEEPLGSSASNASSQPSAPLKSRPVQMAASNSSLPKGPLPICYSSLDSCNAATNNCSGHGSCYRKFGSSSDSGVKDAAGKDCYACRCSPTVLRDSDTRVSTIYWGGSACQKQDVSMPFFLLAGISIILVGAVAWGIAFLFAVGEETLPSVIGAGVSGPRAK